MRYGEGALQTCSRHLKLRTYPQTGLAQFSDFAEGVKSNCQISRPARPGRGIKIGRCLFGEATLERHQCNLDSPLRLELEAAGELDDARSADGKRGSAKRVVVDGPVRHSEIHAVEDIKEVRANGEFVTLRKRNALNEREVRLVEVRPIELVASDLSLPTEGRGIAPWRSRVGKLRPVRPGLNARVGRERGRPDVVRVTRAGEVGTLAEAGTRAVSVAEDAPGKVDLRRGGPRRPPTRRFSSRPRTQTAVPCRGKCRRGRTPRTCA